MEHLGHSWPWYALAVFGAYRLTAAGLDALVRRVTHTALQAALHRHPCTGAAPAQQPGPRLNPRPENSTHPVPAGETPPGPAVPRPASGPRCREVR